MKSDCQHEWVKGPSPLFTETCLWCGLPKVRKSAPVPKLKIPKSESTGRYLRIPGAPHSKKGH